MAFHHDRKFFDTIDFVVFAITLMVPILIGMYYSFVSKKKPNTISEYLVGNRNMNLFPVSMSIAASCVSGYSLIGPISEVYFYGAQYVLQSFSGLITSVIFTVLYLPVFYNLKITSTFEYLQKRFDYKVRVFGSLLFVIKTLFNMAIWIYSPTLMFEQVVGVNLNIIVPIFSGICIFYTFGGVRGVIWADAFQMILMLIGIIAIVIVGVYEIGGMKTIWEINKDGGRLQVFDFNLDPRLNLSFWIIMVGSSIGDLGFITSSQFVVQRCMSLPTLLKSKIAIAVMQIMVIATMFFSCFVGIIVYAAFHDCDPYSVKNISKPDQLLPYFIMNLKNQIPALPSVVISIAFCAALSSISSGLNSTSGVILIDFIQPFSKRPITDAQGSFYMKIITVFLGVIYTGITFTLNKATNVIRLSLSLLSATLGASLGMFTLGVLLPWANEFGALIGGITGAVVVVWISVGNLMASGSKKLSTLPLSVENCGNSTLFSISNQTSVASLISNMDKRFFLYAISPYYYVVIGALTTIIVGMLVSYFVGLNKVKDVDPKLFSPVIHKFLKKEEPAYETSNMMTNLS